MVGILIVTHGNFGSELLKSAELIMGKQDNVVTLNLNADDDIQQLMADIGTNIELLDKGKGVLVMADLFGGSPANAAIANMRKFHFQCLTGVNLPMLLEGLNLKDSHDLETLTKGCFTFALEGIKNIHDEIKI